LLVGFTLKISRVLLVLKNESGCKRRTSECLIMARVLTCES
jgi:hypothetical protein